MKKKVARLKNPKKVKKKRKETGTKKGGRANSCNDAKTLHGTLQNGDTYTINQVCINSSLSNRLRFNREFKMKEAEVQQ